MMVTKQFFYDPLDFVVTLQYDYKDISQFLQILCNNFPKDVSHSCGLLHRQFPMI